MAMWKLRGYQSRRKLPVSQLSSKDMTNNTSERDKEIDEAADKWEHETYDDYKDSYSFKEGARWADSHPAPTGKVLSDEEVERLQFCRDEWAKNALHSTHLRRNYFWLIETLERLTEQPVGER